MKRVIKLIEESFYFLNINSHIIHKIHIKNTNVFQFIIS